MKKYITNLISETEDFCDYCLNLSSGHVGIINSLINFMKHNSDKNIEININHTSVEIAFTRDRGDN